MRPKQEITVEAALIIVGSSVYHVIQGNVGDFYTLFGGKVNVASIPALSETLGIYFA